MKRILYPPHWALLFAAVEVAFARWLPIARWPLAVRLVGGVVIALGLTFGFWAISWFRRKKTGLRPFSESTALVIEGPYRFTRNPIYLGFTLVLTGLALALGAASALIAPVIFALVITFRFILPEEEHMERAFGDSYLELKNRVRRWL